MPEEMIKQLVNHSQNMDTFGVYGHQINGELEVIQKSLDLALEKWIPDDLLEKNEQSQTD